MTWLARFAVWLTALSALAMAIGEPYRAAVASVTSQALQAMGIGLRIRELRIEQPLHLALFAALCLASRRAPRRAVWRALLLGIPLLAVFGLVTVLAVTAGFQLLRLRGMRIYDPAPRLLAGMLDSLPWLSAPVAWIVLLGPAELGQRWRGAASKTLRRVKASHRR